ncbi:hypothetical protein ACQPZA_33830 [Pseudonocardia xinjiangensis]|uniref:hypothetical protein n=1 Tax=Pseudonocardia xinjiangensis TaxID=75289 RepID=UPI003D92DCA5
MRLRSAAAPFASLALVGALAVGVTPPAAAQPAVLAIWTPDLTTGEPAGVRLDGGSVRLDGAGAYLAPVEEGSAPRGAAVPTGLLTLRPQQLPGATDRVVTTVVGDVPAGSDAVVDVRGRRAATGGWTEWIPAEPSAGGMVAELPEPTSEVQGRLVITGPPGSGPTVRGITLAAQPATGRLAQAGAEQAAVHYRVFATREGLVGGTTANGHVITERDHFVALPSRRGLSPRDTSDYSVKVCAPNGRCAFAPVWDVGPWNTRDDYWNPPSVRQEWRDLPQGLPQSQAAYKNGYNDGKDQFDRTVLNPAGIDLADGLFWDALELDDNAWVTVDYLWTGNERLSAVVGDLPVLAAPDPAAPPVGIAANGAAVPVQCVLGQGADRWLRIGAGQYLAGAAVPDIGAPPGCATAVTGTPDTMGRTAG